MKTIVGHLITLLITITMATNNTAAQQKVQGHFAQVNGLKMYYEIHGTGTPLVLIHGGGSTIYTTFGNILPELAKHHQIIAVEMQAHGHTQDIDRPLSFEQDADDVAALLQQLHISKASVFGFSNGASTAMQIGIRHPDLVEKLVLASGFYKRAGMQPWFWPMMEKATFADMPQIYKDAYLAIAPNNDKGLLAMFNRDSQRMLTFKDWTDDALRSIQAPALILMGDQDVMTPEHAVEMHRLIAHSKLAIVPGTHGEFIGEIATVKKGSKVPELVVAMVEEFLAEK